MATASAIRAGRAYVELTLENNKFLSRLNSSASKLKKKCEEIQKKAVVTIKIATVSMAPVVYSTKVFSGFDDQMRKVEAVTQTAAEKMGALTDQAKFLGRTTSFTASQVAQGMVELGRAGFKADEIAKSIAAVMNLARGTDIPISDASEIASMALRSFNLNASQMTHVCDVLVATTNNSSQSLVDLGESLKYVAPIAAQTGMSLEDTVKSLGVLANYGIKGSNAGTALKNVRVRMSRAKSAKTYGDLGVKVYDNDGGLRNTADILYDVGTAVQNMTDGERLKVFNRLFGMIGLAGGTVLTTAENFRNLYDAIDNADKVAQKTAATMDAGIGGSVRIALSAVEGLAIAVGNAMTPAAMELMQKIIDCSDRLAKFVENNEGLIRTVAKVGGALIVGATGVKVLTASLGALASITKNAAGLYGRATTALYKMGGGAKLDAEYTRLENLEHEKTVALAEKEQAVRKAGLEVRKIERTVEQAAKAELNAHNEARKKALALIRATSAAMATYNNNLSKARDALKTVRNASTVAAAGSQTAQFKVYEALNAADEKRTATIAKCIEKEKALRQEQLAATQKVVEANANLVEQRRIAEEKIVATVAKCTRKEEKLREKLSATRTAIEANLKRLDQAWEVENLKRQQTVEKLTFVEEKATQAIKKKVAEYTRLGAAVVKLRQQEEERAAAQLKLLRMEAQKASASAGLKEIQRQNAQLAWASAIPGADKNALMFRLQYAEAEAYIAKATAEAKKQIYEEALAVGNLTNAEVIELEQKQAKLQGEIKEQALTKNHAAQKRELIQATELETNSIIRSATARQQSLELKERELQVDLKAAEQATVNANAIDKESASNVRSARTTLQRSEAKRDSINKAIVDTQAAIAEARAIDIESDAAVVAAKNALKKANATEKLAKANLKAARAAYKKAQAEKVENDATLKSLAADLKKAKTLLNQAKGERIAAESIKQKILATEKDAIATRDSAKSDLEKVSSLKKVALAAQQAASKLAMVRSTLSMIGSIAAFAAITAYYQSLEKASKKAAEASERVKNAYDKDEEERARDTGLLEELKELNEKTEVTNEEFMRGCEIVAILRKRYGDLGITIDDATKKFGGLDNAMKKLDKAQRKHRVDGLQNQIDAKRKEIKAIERDTKKLTDGILVNYATVIGSAFGGRTTAERVEDLYDQKERALKDIKLLQDEINLLKAEQKGAEQDKREQVPIIDSAVMNAAKKYEDQMAGFYKERIAALTVMRSKFKEYKEGQEEIYRARVTAANANNRPQDVIRAWNTYQENLKKANAYFDLANKQLEHDEQKKKRDIQNEAEIVELKRNEESARQTYDKAVPPKQPKTVADVSRELRKAKENEKAALVRLRQLQEYARQVENWDASSDLRVNTYKQQDAAMAKLAATVKAYNEKKTELYEVRKENRRGAVTQKDSGDLVDAQKKIAEVQQRQLRENYDLAVRYLKVATDEFLKNKDSSDVTLRNESYAAYLKAGKELEAATKALYGDIKMYSTGSFNAWEAFDSLDFDWQKEEMRKQTGLLTKVHDLLRKKNLSTDWEMI